MNIEQLLQNHISEAIEHLFGEPFDSGKVQIQQTRKEFEGDVTFAVFPIVRLAKKSPDETATILGAYLTDTVDEVEGFNVVKGFLNLTIDAKWWMKVLQEAHNDNAFGTRPAGSGAEVVMVEYSSPNTNKPLHLGHIRNNLLGYSLGELVKANGKQLVKTNIVNDRGIHICKSMVAWQQWGHGKTPENSGVKGDHLVGEFYVKFDKQYKSEIAELVAKGMSQEDAENQAPSIEAAREMLRKWEAHDPEILQLWSMMNGWVYEGFDATYKAMGVNFDKIYYESETYLLGKEEVIRGVREGIFEQRSDSSVWADLTDAGLDQKLLLRSDGTSVYITQDIGTAKMRYDDFAIDKMVYVVGNEQNYHFQVLSVLLDKLGYAWGKDLFHFSYGMVELPSGKMKSREGTVVDADDLIEEMKGVARKMGEELGKLEGLTEEEASETYRMIALGALKYYILKVDPRKNMLFNPEESIDFNGNTGPFIQYTHARIRSVLRKASDLNLSFDGEIDASLSLSEKERTLLKTISKFPEVVHQAADSFSPALVANYCYEITKEFNQFYHEHSILNEPSEAIKHFRLKLSAVVAKILRTGMGLLGIEMPERM